MTDNAETILIPETEYTITDEGTLAITAERIVPFTSEDANRIRELTAE